MCSSVLLCNLGRKIWEWLLTWKASRWEATELLAIFMWIYHDMGIVWANEISPSNIGILWCEEAPSSAWMKRSMKLSGRPSNHVKRTLNMIIWKESTLVVLHFSTYRKYFWSSPHDSLILSLYNFWIYPFLPNLCMFLASLVCAGQSIMLEVFNRKVFGCCCFCLRVFSLVKVLSKFFIIVRPG